MSICYFKKFVNNGYMDKLMKTILNKLKHWIEAKRCLGGIKRKEIMEILKCTTKRGLEIGRAHV